MDTNKILSSSYLDLLYDGRNKAYGSYELRDKYDMRMRRSVFSVLGLVAILTCTSIAVCALGKRNIEPPVNMREIIISPPPIEPIKPPLPPARHRAICPVLLHC